MTCTLSSTPSPPLSTANENCAGALAWAGRAIPYPSALCSSFGLLRNTYKCLETTAVGYCPPACWPRVLPGLSIVPLSHRLQLYHFHFHTDMQSVLQPTSTTFQIHFDFLWVHEPHTWSLHWYTVLQTYGIPTIWYIGAMLHHDLNSIILIRTTTWGRNNLISRPGSSITMSCNA